MTDLEAVTAVWVDKIYSVLKHLTSAVFVLNAELCQHLLTTAINIQIFMLITSQIVFPVGACDGRYSCSGAFITDHV